MVGFRAHFVTEVLEPVIADCRIDFAMMGEDMAYNRGPHMSPRMVGEFLVPGYKEETRFARAR